MEKYVRSYLQDRRGDIIKVSICCFLRIKIDRVRCTWVRQTSSTDYISLCSTLH